MANIYPTFATDLTAQSVDILAAFSNAEAELASQGAVLTLFLELGFDGTNILRMFDGAVVSTLPAREQLRLFSQLNGLFFEAMKTVLY